MSDKYTPLSFILFFFIVTFMIWSSGCASKELKIGGIISMSGAAEPYGKVIRNGMDLAVEEINEAGGINGKKVVVIYKDDETNSSIGVAVARELIINERVPVIIGPVSSSVSLAVAKICEDYRRVMLSPASSTPKLSKAGAFIFRNYPSDIVEGTFIADFARELGIEKVVVIAVDNEFGNGIKEVFIRQFRSKFREILKVFSYPENDMSLFSSFASEIAELKPEAVYLCGYSRDMADMLQEIKKRKLNVLIFSVSAVNQEMVERAGDASEGVMFPQPAFYLESDDPAMKRFIEKYRDRFQSEPDNFAAHGYDAVHLIAEAIRRVKSTHPDDIRRGLIAINNYEGAAGRTTFDSNGDVVQHPRIFVIHDGKFVQFDRYIQKVGSIKIPGR